MPITKTYLEGGVYSDSFKIRFFKDHINAELERNWRPGKQVVIMLPSRFDLTPEILEKLKKEYEDEKVGWKIYSPDFRPDYLIFQ